jgi:hypothetical protein
MSRTSQVAAIVFGSVLLETLRESDLVTYVAVQNQYAILLTESTKEQAQKAIERLGSLYYQRTQDRLRAGIAEFPDDALTLEELVVSAQRKWQEQPVAWDVAEVKRKPNGHRVVSGD